MSEVNARTAILLIYCPDHRGIVAKVTEFLNENNGNILYLEQHVDREENIFFMRVEWDLAGFAIPAEKVADYFQTLLAARYGMTWTLHFSDQRPRMAVFVTRMSHCLFDILARHEEGEWPVEIPLVIGNNETLRPVAERFGIPFHCFPITKENKREQEERQVALLREQRVDLVVLARYMQIVSPEFIREFPDRIINIHHSFLPAFPGAKPYHSAHARGVKIIGATSHYVTAELDAGPIIEQDVARVSHGDPVSALVRKGQDLEKIVLSRAIYAHIQHKILVYRNRTVVFN
jgi:formyltetrahydrofolate deformylase